MKQPIKVLIISGSVGSGKSTTAEIISEKLKEKGILHAVVDMDYLRYSFPRPKDDPFHRKIGTKNLAAVWHNYEEIGVKYLVVPNVVENQEDLKAIKTAIPDAQLLTIRLGAQLETVHSRLHDRESGESLKWHLNRAVELTKQLESANIEDVVVDTENKSSSEVADEILTSWLDQ